MHPCIPQRVRYLVRYLANRIFTVSRYHRVLAIAPRGRAGGPRAGQGQALRSQPGRHMRRPCGHGPARVGESASPGSGDPARVTRNLYRVLRGGGPQASALGSDSGAVARADQRKPGPTGPRLIQRGDLLASLDRAAEAKLTLISAPAGSGKTSLLRAWADGPGQPYRLAVVQVQRDQQDSQQFWIAVLSAIRRAPGTSGEGEHLAATPDFNQET